MVFLSAICHLIEPRDLQTLTTIRRLTVSTFQIASRLIPQERVYLNHFPSLCRLFADTVNSTEIQIHHQKIAIPLFLKREQRAVYSLTCNLATNHPLSKTHPLDRFLITAYLTVD